MAFTRQQHLQLARIVSRAGKSDQGAALALMGVGIILLLIDLDRSSSARSCSEISPSDTIQFILNPGNTLSS